MILYLLIANRNPSIEGPQWMTLPNILKGKRPDLTFIKEKTIKTLIQKCWSKKPKDRPSMNQVIEMMTDNDFYSIFRIESFRVLNFIQIFPLDLKRVENIVAKQIHLKRMTPSRDINVVCLGYNKLPLVYECAIKSNKLIVFPPEGCFKYFTKIKKDNIDYTIYMYDYKYDFDEHLLKDLYYKADAFVFFTDVSIPQYYNKFQIFLDAVPKLSFENPFLYLTTENISSGWKNTKEELDDFANRNHMKLLIESKNDKESYNLIFNALLDDLIERYPF